MAWLLHHQIGLMLTELLKLLLFLLPVIGAIVLIVFLAQEGKAEVSPQFSA